ncbi:MAG TPA: hypothetical protein VGC32_17555 [Solirubrobacterales bacterium]
MKRSAGIAAAIAELACLVGLLVAQPAAASGWTAPVRLGGYSGQPSIALLGGGGGAAAVWQSEEDGPVGIYGAVRGGGKWRVSGLSGRAFEPMIAPLGGDEGGAIAVWVGRHGVGRQGVEAAIVAAAGGWARLPEVPHSGEASAPRVASDATGRVTVVWEQPGPRGSTIDVATRVPGGDWSAPQRLSRPGQRAEAPHLAVDPAGAAVAVWRRDDGAHLIVQAAVRRDASAPWSAPVDLSAKGENAGSPAVAIDPDGEAVAAWQRFDGSHHIVQVSARPADGRWAPPIDLSARGRNAAEVRVALSSKGEAIAIWERFDGVVERIQASTRAAAGGWSAPENLTGLPGSAHYPRLAIDPDGLARAVWEGYAPRGSSGGRIEEESRPPGGPWSAPETIEVPELWPEPALAVGADGEAAVAWSGYSVGAVLRPAAPPSP